ncbi:MAG: dihydrolipoyl dehydrogenase [Myxococcales bacterium]|nr:dihydrolipoyl dehydrogenase [Myxococcales bacterium]
MSTTCDLCVIGSGPGGYVAAIRAAQRGLSVVCVERESLGGICLNWGCIPTKALLRSAEVLETCERAAEFGIIAENISFDFEAIIKRSRGISARISKGVAYLLKENKVQHIQGTGRLAGAGMVKVSCENGDETIIAKDIIVATGARARSLPGIEVDGDRIIAYREALTLKDRPESLVVLGAGAIGVEFASFYRSLGTEVTIIEYQDRLVPNEDAEISAELLRAYRKRGIKTKVGYSATRAIPGEDGVSITVEPAGGGAPQPLKADKLLVSIGITGNVENLGLEDVGIDIEHGFMKVGPDLRTSVQGIWGIGDVTGGIALAHVASAEAIYVAETIAGHHAEPVDYGTVPSCTYCHPEIASVGFSEEKARHEGIAIKVGRFPFGPLGKTMAAGEYPGFAKFIWREDNGALVGAHLIGPAVTELIAEPTLAKSTEVNAESLINTIHAHPTFAEALKEAAEDAYGLAIHI